MISPIPNSAFIAYLRHHGFPSPFLDWTISPYIAAYFAFNEARETKSEFVSIYCLQEWLEEGKDHSGNEPIIVSVGTNLKTHKRHYMQQSQYTVCKKPDRENYIYCSHEEIIDLGKKHQDVLWRYLIPTTERETVLNRLDMMNINSYTLFDTEESLMDVLSRNEIEL